MLDCGLQPYLQSPSITASNCISKLAQSRSPTASLNSLAHCLQVHPQTWLIAASKSISKVARSWPRVASPKSLDRGLQVHLQIASVTASRSISKLSRLQHPSSHDDGLQVHQHTRLNTASKCISKLAQSRPPSASLTSIDHGLGVSLSTLDRHVQVHRELLSSTAYSQSRYTVCRCVAIYRYIDI